MKSKKIELSDRFARRVSGTAQIITLATAVTASFTLAGCEKPDTIAYTYQSETQCKEAGVFTEKACHEFAEKARADHMANAPRFESKKDCEDTYGSNACETQPSNGNHSSFMPFMMGYMIGHNSNNGPAVSNYTPVYPSAAGGYTTANGAHLGKNAFSGDAARTGVSTYKSSMSRPSPAGFQSHSSVVSRGGFGLMGRGMSVSS